MISGHEMGGRENQEHGTSRNIAEHRGTPNNDDSEEDM